MQHARHKETLYLRNHSHNYEIDDIFLHSVFMKWSTNGNYCSHPKLERPLKITINIPTTDILIVLILVIVKSSYSPMLKSVQGFTSVLVTRQKKYGCYSKLLENLSSWEASPWLSGFCKYEGCETCHYLDMMIVRLDATLYRHCTLDNDRSTKHFSFLALL